MRNHLIPVLLVLALPAFYLAWRLGWLAHRWLRWIGGIAGTAAVIWSLPWQGVELVYVKRINLVLAAATALFLLLRHLRVAWTRQRSRRSAVLAVLATLAAVNYTNFFAFHGHGTRAFIHLHDVVHYYLGAKYYAELGYTDLYTAMLRAEAELTDNRFKALEARDLKTYERVHIRRLLRRSDPVKAAFTPERWHQFQRDVELFRQRLNADHYGKILLDHGFNPTPVWAQIGGALAGLVPGGSHRGILLLCLLDPLLLALLFAAIARAFGLEAMLLASVHFGVVFGGTFGWTGGAFLRHLWLAALVLSICCLHRRRHLAAGTLLALSTALRVFPVFFLAPLVFKAATAAWKRRTLPARYRAFFGAFAATLAVLFALTAWLPRGLGHWREFRANMSNHVTNISPNVVGLTEALTFQRGDRKVTAEEFGELKERRQKIYRVQLVVAFLPAVLVAAWLCRRRTDLAAAALALPLLYFGVSLAAYYYVMLVTLICVHRRSPERLALIFAAETVPYVLMLFEDRDGLLFVYRGLSLAFLFVALEISAARRQLAARLAARGSLAALLVVAVTLASGCVAAPESSTPPRHVLLLTVDTLRSDHLSANGYDLPTTPYLDGLLAGGVAFPRTLAPVPRTTPALASLLTGAYPHTTGVRTLYDPMSDTVVSLAEILRRNGFHTSAVVSNHVLTRERRLDRGFEVYDAAGDGRGARDTTDAALALAGDGWRGRSVLLWVHYIDPHVPYLPPRELAEAFDPGYDGRYAHGFGPVAGGVGDRAYPPDLPKAEAVYRNPLPEAVNAHIRRLYAADVRATDEEIARLIEGLKIRVRNDWLVVFTADHGESLGEHDFFWDHGDYVYNASLQVPLGFVLPPGDPRARGDRVEHWVSLVDVMPTLLELLEIDVPAEAAEQIEGRSLLPFLEGNDLPPIPVFAESGKSFYPQLVRRRVSFDVAGRFRAAVLGDWKLIWTPGQTPEMEYELYDLAADPAETRNLWTAGHPRAEILTDHLHAWFRETDQIERAPSAEDLERLRSLGYLE